MMQTQESTEDLQKRLENIDYAHRILGRTRMLPVEEKDTWESLNKWLKKEREKIKASIAAHEKRLARLRIRQKWLSFALIGSALLNSFIMMFWSGSPIKETTIFAVAILLLLSLGKVAAETSFIRLSMVICVPLIIVLVLYYIPKARNFIENYGNAITTYGTILAIMLAIIPVKIFRQY